MWSDQALTFHAQSKWPETFKVPVIGNLTQMTS